jgi:hypothetical protein
MMTRRADPSAHLMRSEGYVASRRSGDLIMARKTRLPSAIALAAGLALFVSICTQAYSREPRWSLDPIIVPFPCGAVNLDGDHMTFLEPLVFVCNGNEIEEFPAGSYLGINIMCYGATAIMDHNFDQKNGLFDVARKSCLRVQRRAPARKPSPVNPR